jgi:hypothetical protein
VYQGMYYRLAFTPPVLPACLAVCPRLLDCTVQLTTGWPHECVCACYLGQGKHIARRLKYRQAVALDLPAFCLASTPPTHHTLQYTDIHACLLDSLPQHSLIVALTFQQHPQQASPPPPLYQQLGYMSIVPLSPPTRVPPELSLSALNTPLTPTI